jgi:transposase
VSHEGYQIGRDASGLTRRERTIAAMMRLGRARNRIAEDIGLSRQRVGQIVNQLREKGVDLERGESDTADLKILADMGIVMNTEQRRREAAQADHDAGIRPDHL